MINVLSRRLRVRDDGAGCTGEKISTFAEFENEDAIVLLGEPGMGKTTFFREASNNTYVTVREFLADPNDTVGEPFFLDALDECKAFGGGTDIIREVVEKLLGLNKPKFRLSCRAADWFGGGDQSVLSKASSSGKIVVLELLPLTESEILNALHVIVSDPNKLVHEVKSAGLDELLGNPLTLELIASAWEKTNRKPRNKYQVFEMGISELVKEMNDYHGRKQSSIFDPNELMEAAGAAFSVILLSKLCRYFTYRCCGRRWVHENG